MFEIKKQDNNGRKTLATLGNLKLACAELGISDDKHTVKRAARAFDLYHNGNVEHVNDHTFNVKSQYTNRLPYQVWISPTGTSYCTCPDWRNYSGDLVLPDVHFHCKHAISARIWLHHNGNGWRVRSHALGSKVVNECGTSEAKALQKKLNGDNGTGGESHPSTQLDTSNPFQECEQLDIDQIEGRSPRVRSHAPGDLVHKLSNGEYIISYNGIMALADKHGVTFTKHTVKSDAQRNGTVIAHARLGNNTRASGKPMNGSFITAVELAKRNAARQLLPLPEIKALEHKAKLEAEFSWEVAKAKCLELVPDFKFIIIIHDLVKEGKLRQAHSSDYSRKEWLLIFDTCKHDVETNGNDDNDGDGDNTPSSDRFTECKAVAKHPVRYSWLKADMLKEGVVSDDWTDDDIEKLKGACEIDASLFGKELGHWTVDIQPNTNAPYVYQRRYWFWLTPMTKRCFWCDETEGVMPDTCIHWKRYEIKASLCLECSQKVGKGELDKARKDSNSRAIARECHREAIVQRFDDLYHGVETVPDTADEFVERCKEMESEVDDTVDESVTAPMGEGTQMDGNGGAGVESHGVGACDRTRCEASPVCSIGTDGTAVRKLQMDKKLRTWLIEPDGTKKEISCREICETFNGNIVMQLRAGIDCGGDISTVELDK